MLYHKPETPDIDNFIIMFYQLPDTNAFFPDYETLNECNRICYRHMLDQLRRLYPRTKIHVITNFSGLKPELGLYIHHVDLEHNFLNKFRIFELLDEPAMYLDLDVVLSGRFHLNQLRSRHPFKVYKIAFFYDLQMWSPVPFPSPVANHWNTGIVWIPHPHASLADKLRNIHAKYFDHLDHVRSIGREEFYLNDEHAVSFLIETEKWTMREYPRVNYFYIPGHEPPRYTQSIHYAGPHCKKILLDQLRDKYQ